MEKEHSLANCLGAFGEYALQYHCRENEVHLCTVCLEWVIVRKVEDDTARPIIYRREEHYFEGVDKAGTK